MEKFCECGCDNLAPICTHTSVEKGWVLGEPIRFISGHNSHGKKRSTHCPKGHPLSGENAILSPSRGIAPRTGKPYRQGLKCRICTKQMSQDRRSTPEGKTERVLEHLKHRGYLPLEELQRAKPIILEFFQRPRELQICPICGDNCSGRKKVAADHSHEGRKFRAMICQECNVTLGHSRE
jgi:hypothetical protein